MNDLIGKNIVVFCMNYIYTGKLLVFYGNEIQLENPRIIYETGNFDNEYFKDAQKLNHNLFINMNTVESYCQTNQKCSP
jgi:hypothetical protein